MTKARRVLLAALLAGVPLVALNAQDSPESLLPPGFDEPEPAPAPARRVVPPPNVELPASSRPNVETPLSSGPSVSEARADAARRLLERLPSVEELEKMDSDKIDELLGLKPTFDIPSAARRSTEIVGLLSASENGMPAASLTNYSGKYVRRVLAGTKRPLVSRWGHILLRRALSSRLAAPVGMDGAAFAALRASLLDRMGEVQVARALVQEVDTSDYTPNLIDAAFRAYVAMGDFGGACPMVQLHARARDDGQWNLLRGICGSFAGETSAMDRIEAQMRRGVTPRIDVLLAQKYAGALGRQRRAVTLEWEDVEEITPWRYGLATATGAAVPEGLIAKGRRPIALMAAVSPSAGLVDRARGADFAATAGIFSCAALVDLYSQIYADPEITGAEATRAVQLREAYVGTPGERLAAMQDIWGQGDTADRRHARQLMTAYAAARMPPSKDYADEAAPLIAAMLGAGLDRNAMRWMRVVDAGSEAWALLVLANPSMGALVPESAVRTYMDDDASAEMRRSRFLVAGLAGLGRISPEKARELSGDLEFDLDRQTRWTRAIEKAGARRNKVLTSYLAALGMQGSTWQQMTPLHLYHIVSALASAGLGAEARMIAAEALARS